VHQAKPDAYFMWEKVTMTKDTETAYRRRYQNALKAHIGRRPSRLSTSRAARSLGRDGVALGMDIFDLVRLHDWAAAQVRGPGATTNQQDEHTSSPEGAFLLEAMKPFEAESRRREQSSNETKHLQLEQLTLEVQRNKQLLVDSQRLQNELQRLTQQILIAQEEERKEISRELHDEVAQILAGINVRLAALKESGVQNNRELQRNITRTQLLVEHSVKVVHRYATKLRPAMLDDLGLIPALRSFIKDLPGSKGLNIRFTSFAKVEALSNIQRTVLYRVAQEALINVIRHARAKNVTVNIQKQKDQVLLEVHDDGRSFPIERILASATQKRLGLLGMRERVEMAEGKFSIRSSPGKGTTVCVELPIKSTQVDTP